MKNQQKGNKEEGVNKLRKILPIIQEIGLDVVSMKLQTNDGNDIDLRIKPASSTDKLDPDVEDKENAITYMTLKIGMSLTNYHNCPWSLKIYHDPIKYVAIASYLAYYVQFTQNLLQIKKCKDDIFVPDISKTPGIEGAQFNFSCILLEMAEIEVSSQLYIYICFNFFVAKVSRYYHIKASLIG